MKKWICLLLAVLMITTMNIPARAASSNIGLEPGQEVPDFTVSLTDGTTASLSELLGEKELVVLNIFATWCAPCEMEFPEMEKVKFNVKPMKTFLLNFETGERIYFGRQEKL